MKRMTTFSATVLIDFVSNLANKADPKTEEDF